MCIHVVLWTVTSTQSNFSAIKMLSRTFQSLPRILFQESTTDQKYVAAIKKAKLLPITISTKVHLQKLDEVASFPNRVEKKNSCSEQL